MADSKPSRELFTFGFSIIAIVFFVRLFDSNRLSRHAILFAHPLAEIDKFAAFRTEGPKGIILPLDLLVAGRTLFHEQCDARRLVGQPSLVERMQEAFRALDQNSSVNEVDRTFPAHCVQANGDAFACGAYDGGNFAMRQRDIDQNAR